MRVVQYCAMGLLLKLMIFVFFIGRVQSRNSGLSESSYTSEDTKPRLCEVGTTACGTNEECLVKGTYTGSKFGVCECADDFRRSSSGECVRKADDTISSLDGAFATCEFGVEFCGENEECKVKNKRSKTGLCVCLEGYTRNKMKVCEHNPSNVTQVHTKTTKAPSNTHSQLVADAGPDLTIAGPGALVVIDGRERSRGDIVQFSWRRAESSLASGRILNGSEQQHTLLFVPAVTGQYEFILTVTSQSGATAHDNVRITVQDVVGHRTIVMQLANAAYRFSEADMRGLETQIELLLGKPSTALNARPLVVVDSLTEHASDSSLTIEFSVVFELLDSSLDAVTHAMWTEPVDVRPGANSVRYGDSHWVVDYLEQKLEEQRSRLLDFEVLHVGPKYCAYRVQDSTSNVTTLDRCGTHAKCVDERRCACESLWLQSPTRRLRTHCDISLLAVIFLPIGIFLLLVGLVFACVRLCCARRRSLEERVRARLAKRERGRREVKRLLSDGSQKVRVEDKNVLLNNLFDSDDNYEVDMDTDDESGKTERDTKVRGIKSNGAMNKLTVDADGDLNDAEVTAFVNDNVSVNVKSSMNLNSQKMDKTKA